MDPVRLVVAVLVAGGLTFTACARSGFHASTYTDGEGVRHISVWRWFGYWFLVFYAGVPVLWWFIESADDITFTVETVTLWVGSHLWMLPALVACLAVMALPVIVWRRSRRVRASLPQPVPQQPPTADGPVAAPVPPAAAAPGWSLPPDVEPDALRHDAPAAR